MHQHPRVVHYQEVSRAGPLLCLLIAFRHKRRRTADVVCVVVYRNMGVFPARSTTGRHFSRGCRHTVLGTMPCFVVVFVICVPFCFRLPECAVDSALFLCSGTAAVSQLSELTKVGERWKEGYTGLLAHTEVCCMKIERNRGLVLLPMFDR